MPRRAEDGPQPPDGEPSRELLSFPLFWAQHPLLSEEVAREEWAFAWKAWLASGPRTLARLNRSFEADVDRGPDPEPDLRVVERGRLWAAEHPDATVTGPSLAGDDASPCPACPAVVRAAAVSDGEGLAGASVRVVTIEHVGSCPWFDRHGGDDPIMSPDGVLVHYAIATGGP